VSNHPVGGGAVGRRAAGVVIEAEAVVAPPEARGNTLTHVLSGLVAALLAAMRIRRQSHPHERHIQNSISLTARLPPFIISTSIVM
jgi:hypothetical protein